MAESLSVRNGKIFVENRATIILGLSIGNAYFQKVENHQKLLEFANKNSDQIMVFLTAKIYEHNYRAIGSKNPRKSANAQRNSIRNKCQKAMVACGMEKQSLSYIDWTADVETSPAYIEALNYLTNLYQVNETFRTDIRQNAEAVLTSLGKSREKGQPDSEVQIDYTEGILYPLKELAFLSAVPKIYKSCEQYVYVYHKPWDWCQKFFDGDYDGIVRSYFGFYILNE